MFLKENLNQKIKIMALKRQKIHQKSVKPCGANGDQLQKRRKKRNDWCGDRAIDEGGRADNGILYVKG